jgi:hypothetical protein
MQTNAIRKILRNYLSCIKKLEKLEIVRTNNITSELGEYFACKKLKLTRAKKGNKGFDAIDKKGKKYEIKTRKTNQKDDVKQTFPIYNLKFNYFDYLLLVNLDYYFELERIIIIPTKVIKKFVKKKQNKSRFGISNELLKERGVKDIHIGGWTF